MEDLILTDAFDNSDKVIIKEEDANLERCLTISCNIGKIYLDEKAVIALKDYINTFVDNIK